jgi:hypothetical protein
MPEEQRTFHIITEALALPVGAFLIYLGLTIQAKQWKKTGLIIIGAGNMIIDGWLLLKWAGE